LRLCVAGIFVKKTTMKTTVKTTNGSRNHTASELRDALLTGTAINKKKSVSELNRAIAIERDNIKRTLSGYDVIREYIDDQHIGIAYNEAGDLVEFYTLKGGLGELEMTVHEITLAESLEWAEKMLFAEVRLGWCAQCGDAGQARWFRALRTEVC